jgi:hypothetical protein
MMGIMQDSIPTDRSFTGKARVCKYHLINWPTICWPKAMGGLGFLNTKKMNISLLLKGVWRLYQE